jgi:hypothetical protein
MGEVVNLRMARKRKKRDEQAALAENNRLKHGRTRAEREAQALARANEARTMDAHLRERTDGRPKD